MSGSAGNWVQSRVWMVISLVIVCAVAAFGLAQVYSATKPVIEQQRIEAINRALNEVLPEATRFEEQIPDTLWYGFADDGNRVGSVIKVTPNGYSGPIETIAGIALDGQVTGVFITSLKETPGLGLKATEPRFRDQFKGLTADELRLKRDGGEIEAISAATITARAVTDGIRQGIERHHDRLLPDTLTHKSHKSDMPHSSFPSDSAPSDQP